MQIKDIKGIINSLPEEYEVWIEDDFTPEKIEINFEYGYLTLKSNSIKECVEEMQKYLAKNQELAKVNEGLKIGIDNYAKGYDHLESSSSERVKENVKLKEKLEESKKAHDELWTTNKALRGSVEYLEKENDKLESKIKEQENKMERLEEIND